MATERTATRLGLLATAVLSGGLLLVPGTAAPRAAPVPATVPFLNDAICRATPPRPDLSWADAIRPVPAADAAIPPADQADMLLKLGLLQGHLVIGRALVEAGQPGLALPHFGHPVRELWEDLAPEVARHGAAPFDGELVSLEALAAAGAATPAFAAQFDKVLRILDALRATVPAALRDDERFALGVLAEIATAAAGDYKEAIEGDRVAKPVEYHDSRGYLMFADAELARLAARPRPDPAMLKAATARIHELQAMVAPLLPPRAPLATVARFRAVVGQLKAAVRGGKA